MALFRQLKSKAISAVMSEPSLQLRTPRSFRLTLTFVLLIVISGLLTLHSLSRVHDGICKGPSLFASTSICTSVLQAVWNLLYHLGGNGPWIRRMSGLYYYDAPLPKICSIDQVHMVGKVAKRYELDTDLLSCRVMLNDTRQGMPAAVGSFDY